MIEELDCVTAKRDLSEKITAGTRGAVVMVYTQPSVCYEVEFFDENGESLGLKTIANDQDLDVYWKVNEVDDTP